MFRLIVSRKSSIGILIILSSLISIVACMTPASLYKAIEAEDRETIIKHLDDGVKPTAKVAFSRYGSPLHLAVARGDEETIELLLSYEADINAGNDEGATPLEVAIGLSKQDVALMLLEKGADPTLTYNEINKYPILSAAELGLPLVVTKMLDMGVDAHVTDKSGNTALHYAVEMKSEFHGAEYHEIILYLLENGLKADAKNNIGLTPIEIWPDYRHGKYYDLEDAVRKNDISYVEAYLRLGGEFDPDGAVFERALTATAPESAMLLLEYGANPLTTWENDRYGTVSRLAASVIDLMNPAVTTALIERGADVSWQDRLGRTLLHYLCIKHAGKDMVDVVHLLVEKGVDPNAVTGYDESVLFTAATSPASVEIVRALISLGAATGLEEARNEVRQLAFRQKNGSLPAPVPYRYADIQRALFPDTGVAFEEAATLFEAGEYLAAEKRFSEVIAAEKKNFYLPDSNRLGLAYTFRAGCRELLNEIPGAIEDYAQAVALAYGDEDEDDAAVAPLLEKLAEVNDTAKDHQKAAEAYQAAMSTYAKLGDTEKTLSSAMRAGESYVKADMSDVALTIYTIALALAQEQMNLSSEVKIKAAIADIEESR